MEIYGIAATEDQDKEGEKILLDGMDISNVKLFNDEHESRRMFEILGEVKQAKKIYSDKDCEDDFQIKCWQKVKRPFLYVRGELADDQGHPNAQAAAALIKYGSKHSDQLQVGFSVEGRRVDAKGPVLTKTEVHNISLTVSPANPNTCIFPVIDLAKSAAPAILPEKYKNVSGRKQFRCIPDEKQLLLAKSAFLVELKELAKSTPEVQSNATIMRCWNCGTGKVFMKSKLPNRCTGCGEAFTMKDILTAKNKNID